MMVRKLPPYNQTPAPDSYAAGEGQERSAADPVYGDRKMASEVTPNSGNGADLGGILALAATAAAIIGGVGAVLVVDRDPTLDINEVFPTSWMTLMFILTAFFILIRGVRTGVPRKWGKLGAQFLLFGLVTGAGGVLLSLADLWSFVAPLAFLAFGVIARLRKRKRQAREQPQL